MAVDRVKVSTTHERLHGRVLDGQDHPIANATIERSPNRYTSDDWLGDETTIKTKSDPWKAGVPLTVGSPVLGYRSIQKQHGYPTVKSDAEGRFDFHDVALGEYVLTVEADGYAPQHRHVRSKVMDETGRGVPGICVVLNQWHVHTDSGGYFHWSVEAPLPEQVEIRVYKRYSGQYKELETLNQENLFESGPTNRFRQSINCNKNLISTRRY